MFMVGALLRFGSVAAWVFHIIACMGDLDLAFYWNAMMGFVCCAFLVFCFRKVAEIYSVQNYSIKGMSSSGCLGCDNKPKLSSTLHDPFKGQNNNAWKTSKGSLSEDFWTTSTVEMENSAPQSHGSISSTSTLIQLQDAYGAGSSSKPSEFVNHGLILWNQTRQKWIGNKKPENRADELLEPRLSNDRGAPKLNLYHRYISMRHRFLLGPSHPRILMYFWLVCKLSSPCENVSLYLPWRRQPFSHEGTSINWNATYDSLLSSNKPFRQPIPLGEMVDFLVDIWELTEKSKSRWWQLWVEN
ncbi:hypothetical protein Sango_0134000 [Sesamum angolense]|uniref:Gag1-like clamp domain-containing protein n=1 Tax=Sesamum angolense TaxID=2727404 RepID=A0AAE1XER9_9LAMI|nr:hypothetical protein Sango_0134000 [Sesamum angolense]